MSILGRLVSIGSLVLLSFACATGPQVESKRIETPDGVVFLDTLEMEATVTAVDARNRQIRLKPPHGDEETFTAPPEVRNFAQIQVGDRVRAVVVEETAVQLVRGGTPDVGASAQGIAVAPRGAKPGAISVDAAEVFATVVAIDGHDHTLTVEFPDGVVKELPVARHRDLSQVALGDAIRFRVTQAVALSVEPASRKK